jgi:hypothetical protein
MKGEIFVHLFHILIVGGLFLYVGIVRTKMYAFMYPILLVLGIIIIVYHIFKVYNYIKIDKPYWVNLIHILLVGPLLIYIGYNGENTSRRYFEMLLMLGFASIGYHGYYLISE